MSAAIGPVHFSAEEIVTRYKSLADIERGFRVLKSDLEIAPVYHRLPDRIRAHALICFLALVLSRVMRMRLKANGSSTSPKTALELLARIQKHRATIGEHVYTGTSKTTKEQLDLLRIPVNVTADSAVRDRFAARCALGRVH